jgi:SDR family mycofactocin-dependent oxidoreductase
MLLKLFRDTATCHAAAVAMSSGPRGGLIVAGGGRVRQPGTSLAVPTGNLRQRIRTWEGKVLMAGRLDGKVALITGAARGQGRSHAVRLAQDGADVIAVDICRQIDSVAYPLATPADLARTVSEVEALGRRIVAAEADVRDAAALRAAVANGVARLGSVDIVVANAGIGMMSEEASEEQAFRDQVEVNLFGAWNTVQAAAPVMIEQGRGGAIVLTGSTLGLVGRGGNGRGGSDGYCASKHAIVGLGRTWAHWLAPHDIRVNSVHPAGANTPMVINEAVARLFASAPAASAPAASGADVGNLLDVQLIEAVDVSNAIAWLVSDEARYVTAVALPVDAGYTAK